MKIEGSASGSRSRPGSADPGPHKNVMDPQHCKKLIFLSFSSYYFLKVSCFNDKTSLKKYESRFSLLFLLDDIRIQEAKNT